jgi:hypothetical protein
MVSQKYVQPASNTGQLVLQQTVNPGSFAKPDGGSTPAIKSGVRNHFAALGGTLPLCDGQARTAIYVAGYRANATATQWSSAFCETVSARRPRAIIRVVTKHSSYSTGESLPTWTGCPWHEMLITSTKKREQ